MCFVKVELIDNHYTLNSIISFCVCSELIIMFLCKQGILYMTWFQYTLISSEEIFLFLSDFLKATNFLWLEHWTMCFLVGQWRMGRILREYLIAPCKLACIFMYTFDTTMYSGYELLYNLIYFSDTKRIHLKYDTCILAFISFSYQKCTHTNAHAPPHTYTSHTHTCKHVFSYMLFRVS